PSSPSSLIHPCRPTANPDRSFRHYAFLVSILTAVVAASLIYQLDSFDPAHFPTQDFSRISVTVPLENPRVLDGAEKVAAGRLLAPEDLAYDPDSGAVCTGCADGWVKRVTVTESAADSAVEDVVNTGGRPLGLVLGHHNEVIVADANKGLLNVTRNGTTKVLTKEAEGVDLRLTNGVDVAEDGVIYFTEASYKYGIKDIIWDMLEGRPHGRLMSFDPSTKQTNVLVSGLYFPNGVAVSPDQQFVVFCETPLRRCRKYYLKGERRGLVDKFIDGLPGIPDNIRYDGEGHYWIAILTAPRVGTYSWELAQRYPFIRKLLAIGVRYIGRPRMEKDGGFLDVDLDGKPVTYYHDRRLSLVTSAIKIGDHLYCGSIVYSYVIRLNLTQCPA
ncbi:Strictosidine synthase, partial [Bertholletia excelsa]